MPISPLDGRRVIGGRRSSGVSEQAAVGSAGGYRDFRCLAGSRTQ
jgi:hypothetical protein